MEPIKFSINIATLERMKKFYDTHMIPFENPEYEFMAQTVGCDIICYKNMTITFTGPNAISEISHWKKVPHKDNVDERGHYIGSHIGVTEYGSKDYFGPICVVSCYVDTLDIDYLKSLDFYPVTALSDAKIIELGKELKDRFVYSLLFLDNPHYNQEISRGANLSSLKARLYNNTVVNVMQKLQQPVSKKVGAQFVAPKTYFNYLKGEIGVAKDLEFYENAELSYYAVAVSYIIAKYAYIQLYTNICRQLKTELPRGCNSSVDVAGAKIVLKYGEKGLIKVAKISFNNTKHIKELLKKYSSAK